MAHCAFNKRISCRGSIFLKQIFLKRTAVYTYSYWYSFRLCCVCYKLHPLAAAYIARIYPDFIHTVLYTFKRKSVIKMYISNKRDMYHFLYFPHSLCRFIIRNCHTDYLTSCFFTQYLFYRSVRITRISITHRLYGNAISSAYFNAANIYGSCNLSIHKLSLLCNSTLELFCS